MHRSKIALLTIVSAFCLFSLTASTSQRQQEESSANSSIEDKGSGGQRKAPKQFEAIAISIVSKNKHKSSEDLIVSSSNVLSFPLIDKKAFSYNVRDKQQGWHSRITLDEKGQEVDVELLLAEEQAARLTQYGKLDPALSEKLEQSQPQESIPVIINLKISPGPEEEPQQPDIVDSRTWKDLPEEEKKAFDLKDKEYRKKKDEFLMRRTKRITTPLVERLEKLGYKVKTDDYLPIIYASLPPDIIRQVAAWDEVAQVSSDGSSRPSLEVSRVAIGADIVESRGNGAFAIQVGMVEVGGRIVSTTGQVNPYLSGTIQNTTNVCSTQSNHPAQVAGVIRCTNIQPPGTRGISPGVTLWVGGSCNGLNSQLQSAASAAVTWGAKVVNNSYEQFNNNLNLTTFDNFYDKLVYDRNVTMVMVAGNSDCSPGIGNVLSPGKGYNVITVGGFDDKNTTGRSDDTMYNCSGWQGPNSLSGDREKPEIVGPAVDIQTTKATGPTWFIRDSGTSLAAPHVTGTVAYMIWRDTRLATRPKEVRAILIASSAFNVSTGSTSLDGAGAISALWADDVTRDFFGAWGRITYDCTYPQDYLAITLPGLQAGLRTRFAITWDTDPYHAEYYDRPSFNLDLIVKDPTGAVMAPGFGDSADNTYEWIEFIAPTSGNYSLYLHREHCNSPTGRIAYAFWQFH